MLSLPFSIIGVPLAAHAFTTTGSMRPQLIGMIGFLSVLAIFVATLRRQTPAPVVG